MLRVATYYNKKEGGININANHQVVTTFNLCRFISEVNP